MTPSSGVGLTPAGFVAQSAEPWLDVDYPLEKLGGRFVEMTTRSSLLDNPVRPIFRFIHADGSFAERIGAAPVAGAAIWIGRVPAGTRRLAISPTNQLGPFGFAVESIRPRIWPRLLIDGFGRRPAQTRSAVLTRLIGWRPESDNNLAWATGAFDMDDYRSWLTKRRRPLDLDGLDRPRFDWSRGPLIRIVVRAAGDTAALGRTLDSLQLQPFGTWQALVIGKDAVRRDTDRILAINEDEAVAQFAKSSPGEAWAALAAGDALPPYALAFVAEQLNRHPDTRVFYGDELAAGRLLMKPGWSPRLETGRPYIGRALFVRDVGAWSDAERRAFLQANSLPPSWIDNLPSSAVTPLRRVLIESEATAPDTLATENVLPVPGARAAVIIPTADHPTLLARALASIRAKSPAETRIVVVDNGRGEAPDARLPAEATRDATVLRRPGAFNFSAFCNEAAATCDEPVLVFLNDDTEVLSDGWLDRLVALALEPHVGAVGVKLTFPDGRLQHMGVLVGMGGSAGHPGAMSAGDGPGWMGRNEVVHEVAAVTGACLAVARDKFLAVGGFDAEHLPIELSDIDLCLKLNARGWQTVVDPSVHLLHEESASRGGATFRRLQVYGSQREIFVERWRHVLRDDPFFHPGLSLYSLPAALG